MEDILCLLDENENGEIKLPTFYASSYDAFPPVSFGRLSVLLREMRDEMAFFCEEMSLLRKEKLADIKALEDFGCVRSDVADIKKHLE